LPMMISPFLSVSRSSLVGRGTPWTKLANLSGPRFGQLSGASMGLGGSVGSSLRSSPSTKETWYDQSDLTNQGRERRTSDPQHRHRSSRVEGASGTSTPKQPSDLLEKRPYG